MKYKEKLNLTKKSYPFKRWRKSYEYGLDQYTQENCDAMKKIFDDLINDLIEKGENASEKEKIESFRIAIEATNELEEKTYMVETGEREDLCKLTNVISIAVGLQPQNYGDGEGLASEWRDW